RMGVAGRRQEAGHVAGQARTAARRCRGPADEVPALADCDDCEGLRPGPRRRLDGLGDLAGLDAGGADVHPLAVAAHEGVDRLDVRVPPAVRPAVRVAELLREVRLLPADLTGG